MPTSPRNDQAIGVFDSGIGGLTVAASLRRLLPHENILYIGDTARVPYGGKSRETVERYSIEIGNLLLAGGAKMIVVACNTASALGVPRMKEVFEVPVVGVVLPGAKAAVDSTKNKTIGVIGTRATIASGAYETAIHSLEPRATIHSAPCPLLVPLIEEGLIDDPITKAGQINVETFRGVVQLGGFVDNATQKAQATKVARSVTGVKEVRNDLLVSTKPHATTGQDVDDSMLTTSVKAKLMDDPTTKAYQINVGTEKGVVQLTGFVDSTAMKTRAGEVARTVDGVKAVRNDLEIRQK
jgi:osmotically-inducible protein OsmY